MEAESQLNPYGRRSWGCHGLLGRGAAGLGFAFSTPARQGDRVRCDCCFYGWSSGFRICINAAMIRGWVGHLVINPLGDVWHLGYYWILEKLHKGVFNYGAGLFCQTWRGTKITSDSLKHNKESVQYAHKGVLLFGLLTNLEVFPGLGLSNCTFCLIKYFNNSLIISTGFDKSFVGKTNQIILQH